MFAQHRSIGFRVGLTILVLLVLVLAGCGGEKPTPTPTPEAVTVAATPVVTILKNPNITDVPVGGQVALAADATGRNLRIKWSVDRGTLSRTEDPSTIYTAPATPGMDTVDVTVTSDSGSTIRTVTFTVVARSTEISTPTSPTITSTPSPSLLGAASITLGIDGTTASGQVSGLDSDQYSAFKVLVYLETDKWYIQPVRGGSAAIQADGSWQMAGLNIIPGVPTTAYAYLVRGDYQAPDEPPRAPQVDGVNIVARADPVAVHRQATPTTIATPLPVTPGVASLTLAVDGTAASGQVSGLDPDHHLAYKVLVYLKTDQWYIQPVRGGSASIQADGSWQIAGLNIIPGVPTTAYAYLVRGDYQAPDESPRAPQVDGVDIIAEAAPVTVQGRDTSTTSVTPLPVTPGTMSITLRVDGTTASGQVSGLDSDQYPAFKVLVYLETDKWYIQPVRGGSAAIQADGSWQMVGLNVIPGVPTTAYAYLVRGDYQAPDESPRAPQVDGADIIIGAEPVEVQ